MIRNCLSRRALLLSACLAGCLFLRAAFPLDVPFVPTPDAVVARMLTIAKVGPKDVVYDLGSGDGRIVITAARKHGARGVGIDIDPERIKEARANARKAGVAGRVEFREGDLFVSHGFDMGDWQPLETHQVGSSTVYYWVVPERK